MVDVVKPAKRSAMMSGIRSKNTKPELMVRKALFAHGFRYRLHVKGLAGKPDMIFAKYRAVVFVHGCFWHCHGCHLFKWPQTRTEFWHKKISSNKARDLKTHSELSNKEWRIAVIWECALKGKSKLEFSFLIGTLEDWLQSDEIDLEIYG